MSNDDRPESTVTPDEVGAAAVAFMDGLTTAFGVEGTSTLQVDDLELRVDVAGSELGLLVGPGGRTLNAIQDLARVSAQRRLGDIDVEVEQDVILAAFEELVWFYFDLNEQISSWAAIGAGLPFTGKADLGAIINACWNRNRFGDGLAFISPPATLFTFIGDDGSSTLTIRTGGHLDHGAKKCLPRLPNLAAAVTGGACFRRGAWLRAAAVAAITHFIAGNIDIFINT